MPAAAVIPAPIAYIKAAAVKKLVVGSWSAGGRKFSVRVGLRCPSRTLHPVLSRCSWLSVGGGRNVYFEEIRVFKAGRHAWIVQHGIME